MYGTQRRVSDDAAGTTAATYLGVGLILLSAIALVIAMFLRFAQPFGAVPIIGNDDLDAGRIFVEHDLHNLSRLESVDDEGRRVG